MAVCLPNELLLQILSFVELESISVCSRCCTSFYELCNEPSLWKARIARGIDFSRTNVKPTILLNEWESEWICYWDKESRIKRGVTFFNPPLRLWESSIAHNDLLDTELHRVDGRQCTKWIRVLRKIDQLSSDADMIVSSECDYPFIPLMLHWDSAEPLSANGLLEHLHPHPEFLQSLTGKHAITLFTEINFVSLLLLFGTGETLPGNILHVPTSNRVSNQ